MEGIFKKRKLSKKGIRNKKERKKERNKELKEKKLLKTKRKASCWLQTHPASSAAFPGCSSLRGNWFSFSPFLSLSLRSCPASSPVPQFTARPPVPFCAQPMPSSRPVGLFMRCTNYMQFTHHLLTLWSSRC